MIPSGKRLNAVRHILRDVNSAGRGSAYRRGEQMKYMLLVHHNEESFRKRSDAERNQMLQESVQLAQQLHASGQYLDAAPLHPSSETTCVVVRDGRSLVTDGPFVETREQLGGYFLIEAKDLEEAIGIATRIPGACIGTVEIRPVTQVAGLPARKA
jgi:hypothetical protein